MRALAGQPPDEPAWMDVLALANQALVTPQLHAALSRSGGIERAPADARLFLSEVARRNHERNQRLKSQLNDALTVLNGIGLEPVLLKGMAAWATLGVEREFDRMMSDIDLLIRPADAERAIAALEGAGLGLLKRAHGASVHVVAEFGRAHDVGSIDLHQRPPGPPGMAEIADLERHCRTVAWGTCRVRVPAPTHQIYFLCLHDQMHDGDYWRGGFDLRHLLDIAGLTGAGQVDFDLFDELMATRLLRNAVQAQLIAAHRFAGADIPAPILRRAWPRLQFQRHLAQFLWPRAALPLAVAGCLSEALNLAAHRRENNAGRRRVLGAQWASSSSSSQGRPGRIRQILSPGAGKL